MYVCFVRINKFPSLSDHQPAAEGGGAAAPAGGGAGAAAPGGGQGEAAQPQHHPGGNPAAQPAAGAVHDQNRSPANQPELLQHPREPAVLPGVRGGAQDGRGQFSSRRWRLPALTGREMRKLICCVFPGRVSQRGGHDRGRASPPRDAGADPADAGGGRQGSGEEEEGAGGGGAAQEAGGAAGAAGSAEEGGAVRQREGEEER